MVRSLQNVTLTCTVVALTIAITIGCGGDGSLTAAPPVDRGSIVVIQLSGVRADHLGCYGAQPSVTPHLDRFAADAARFAWAFSVSGDPAAAQASLLSGLYPTTHQMRDASTQLPEEVITLSEALSAGGYNTTAFVDGGFMGVQFGLLQGFDGITDVAGEGLGTLVPEAVAWLEHTTNQPFLLWLQAHDAQAPFTPPPEDRDRLLASHPDADAALIESARMDGVTEGPLAAAELATAMALYDAELAAADRRVGQLLSAIDALKQPVTVVVTADHGQSFGEHGTLSHGTVHTPVTHIPLLIRLPSSTHAETVETVVDSIDLVPTLLDLAGVEVPQPVQGKSLLPILTGVAQPPFLAFSESASGEQQAVAMAGYRLVYDRSNDHIGLYHLPDDPLESTDLSASDPRRVEVLLRRLDEWQTMVSQASYDPAQQQALDEDTLEQLKGLGYIQ